MRLFFRRLWGVIARIFSPGYSHCGHCKRPWTVCKGHNTPIDDNIGCFPLCSECWSELTPDTRMPYYVALIKWWEETSFVSNEKKTRIKSAVMMGK